MLDNSYQSQILISASSTIKNSLYTVSFLEIILVIFVRLPLNLLFGSLLPVQIITFQNILNVHHPANSHHFNRLVGSCVNFDIFDPKWTVKLVFDFDFDDELGEREELLGNDAFLNEMMRQNEIETFNTVLNLGGNTIILLIGYVLLLMYGFMWLKDRIENKCNCRKKSKCKKLRALTFQRLKDGLFYSFFSSFV